MRLITTACRVTCKLKNFPFSRPVFCVIELPRKGKERKDQGKSKIAAKAHLGQREGAPFTLFEMEWYEFVNPISSPYKSEMDPGNETKRKEAAATNSEPIRLARRE